jgi:hypothetical protein
VGREGGQVPPRRPPACGRNRPAPLDEAALELGWWARPVHCSGAFAAVLSSLAGVPSLPRLTFPDLVADRGLLKRLVYEGETLYVERKETDPQDGLGATVASFANTLGGWLLIGVTDDRKVVGYTPRSSLRFCSGRNARSRVTGTNHSTNSYGRDKSWLEAATASLPWQSAPSRYALHSREIACTGRQTGTTDADARLPTLARSCTHPLPGGGVEDPEPAAGPEAPCLPECYLPAERGVTATAEGASRRAAPAALVQGCLATAGGVRAANLNQF